MRVSKFQLLSPSSREPAGRRRKPRWIAEQDGLTGQAWIGRFCTPEMADYNFRHRHVFFVIRRHGRLVATGKLIVWRGVYDSEGYGWTLEGFVRRGDENSNSEYETAVAVARIWGGDDEDDWVTDGPFCYGDICSFDRLVIDAKTLADVEAAWQIINALVARIRRSMAAMVLKAFPLEYEGKITAENRSAFVRRQRALIRLYERRLGFRSVPHKALAGEGWMLRLLNDYAQPVE
jgi:hypothetical protein